MRERKWRPVLAALVSVCLWASAFVGIRAAGHAISPGALALGRLTIGTLLLGALLVHRGARRPTRREVALLGLAGLLWLGLYNVALNSGEQLLDAGTAAMIVNLAPLFVMVLAGFFLHERLTSSLALGSLVAFGGVAVIGLSTASGTASLRGVLLCLLATAAAAAGLVAQKPALGRLSPLQVSWSCCLVGMLSCIGYVPDLVRDIRQSPSSALGWIVYLGAFPTAVGFTTWAYALAQLEASRLAMMVYLVPPFTIVTSWVALGETPTSRAIGGGALCLCGVILARRTPPVPVPARALPGHNAG